MFYFPFPLSFPDQTKPSYLPGLPGVGELGYNQKATVKKEEKGKNLTQNVEEIGGHRGQPRPAHGDLGPRGRPRLRGAPVPLGRCSHSPPAPLPRGYHGATTGLPRGYPSRAGLGAGMASTPCACGRGFPPLRPCPPPAHLGSADLGPLLNTATKGETED